MPLASPQKGKWGRRKSIDERPACIDRKERFGDLSSEFNKLIRQYLSKGASFKYINDKQI